MLHNFLPSIKKAVGYCNYCGCLSYNNIPSKSILPHKNKIIAMDPLILKYTPISLNIDFSLISHKSYIENRQKGLYKIYFLCNNFLLGKMVTHKAIGLMDEIFLNNRNINVENIEIIASTCVLLSFQFNECCSKPNKIELNPIYDKYKNSLNNNFEFINKNNYYVNNIKGLHSFLIKEINNLTFWQTFCLQKVNYNLYKYSAFDYINLFFGLGIVFTNDEVDIISKYNFCIYIESIIINKYNICKYNQYVIAMSIIYITMKGNKYFDKKVFKYIYGVDFSKQKYIFCINEINKIINNLYHLNYYDTFLFNDYNLNNETNNNKNNNYSKNNNCKIINDKNNSFYELLIKYNFWFEKLKIYNNVNIFNNREEKLKFYYNFLSSLNYPKIQIKNISCINMIEN